MTTKLKTQQNQGVHSYIKSLDYRWKLIINCLSLVVIFLMIYDAFFAVLPFLLGMIIAHYMRPIVDKLQGSRLVNWAILLLISGLYLFLIAAAYFLLPRIYARLLELWQFTQFLSNKSLYQLLINKTAQLLPEIYGTFLNSLWKKIPDYALMISQNILNILLYSGNFAINIVFSVIIAPIIAFYLLKDRDVINNYLRRVSEKNIYLREFERSFFHMLMVIKRTLLAFARAYTLCGLLWIIYYYGCFAFIGLNYAASLAVFIGVLSFIPYFGILISIVIALIMALVQFGVCAKFYYVLAVLLAGVVLDNMVVNPLVLGGRVGLHPIAMFFCLLFASQFFGTLGVILALPVTMLLKALLSNIIKPKEGMSGSAGSR